MEVDLRGEAGMLADYSIKGSAPGKPAIANTDTCVSHVEKMAMLKENAQQERLQQLEERGERPR